MRISAKLMAALTAGILFFIISNPIVYKIVDSVVGGIASPGGCPTTLGLIVHSAVFVAATYTAMGV